MSEIGYGIFGFANWAIRVFYVCLLFLILQFEFRIQLGEQHCLSGFWSFSISDAIRK